MSLRLNNNTIKWRVDNLEKGYASLDTKIDEILQNHLPHLQEEISSLKTRINVMTVINVGAIIVGLVVSKMLA